MENGKGHVPRSVPVESQRKHPPAANAPSRLNMPQGMAELTGWFSKTRFQPSLESLTALMALCLNLSQTKQERPLGPATSPIPCLQACQHLFIHGSTFGCQIVATALTNRSPPQRIVSHLSESCRALLGIRNSIHTDFLFTCGEQVWSCRYSTGCLHLNTLYYVPLRPRGQLLGYLGKLYVLTVSETATRHTCALHDEMYCKSLSRVSKQLYKIIYLYIYIYCNVISVNCW